MQDTLTNIQNRPGQSSDVAHLEQSLQSNQLQNINHLERSFNKEIGLDIPTTTTQRQDLQLGATNLVDGLYKLQPLGENTKTSFFGNIGNAISGITRNIKTSLTLGAKNHTLLNGFKGLIPGIGESISNEISLLQVKQNNNTFINDKVSAFRAEQAKLESQNKPFISQAQIDQYVGDEQAKLDQQYNNIARKVEQFMAMGLDPQKAIIQANSDYNGHKLKQANSFRNTLKGLTYGALGFAGVITFTGPAMLQIGKIFGNVGLTELNHRATNHDKVSREVLEEASIELRLKVSSLLPQIEKGVNKQSYDQIIGVVQNILAQDKLSAQLEIILMDLVGELLAQKENNFSKYESQSNVSGEISNMVTFLERRLNLKSKKQEINKKSEDLNSQGFWGRVGKSGLSNVINSGAMIGFSWLSHQFNAGGNIVGAFNKFTAKEYVMPITGPDGTELGSAVSTHSPNFAKFKELYGEPTIRGDLAVFETNGEITENDILASIQKESLNLDNFAQKNVTALVDGKPIAIPGLSAIEGKEGFNGVTIRDSYGNPHTFSKGNSGNPFNTNNQTVLGRIGNQLILADEKFDPSPEHLDYLKKELGLEPYSATGGASPIPELQKITPLKGNLWGVGENGLGGHAGFENAQTELIKAGNLNPDGRAIIEQTFRIQGRDNLDAFGVNSKGFAQNQTEAYFKGLKQIYGWDDETIVKNTLSGQVPKSDALAEMMSKEALKINPNAPQFVGMRNELMAASDNPVVPGLVEEQPGVYKNPALEVQTNQDTRLGSTSNLDPLKKARQEAAKFAEMNKPGWDKALKNTVDNALPAAVGGSITGGVLGGVKEGRKNGWKAIPGGIVKGGILGGGIGLIGGAGLGAISGFGGIANPTILGVGITPVVAGGALEALRRVGPANYVFNKGENETTYGQRAFGNKPPVAATNTATPENPATTTANTLANPNQVANPNEALNTEILTLMGPYEDARLALNQAWVTGSDPSTWPNDGQIRGWINSINILNNRINQIDVNSLSAQNQTLVARLRADLQNTNNTWANAGQNYSIIEALEYLMRERGNHATAVGGNPNNPNIPPNTSTDPEVSQANFNTFRDESNQYLEVLENRISNSHGYENFINSGHNTQEIIDRLNTIRQQTARFSTSTELDARSRSENRRINIEARTRLTYLDLAPRANRLIEDVRNNLGRNEDRVRNNLQRYVDDFAVIIYECRNNGRSNIERNENRRIYDEISGMLQILHQRFGQTPQPTILDPYRPGATNQQNAA